jgi:hypothetical protein
MKNKARINYWVNIAIALGFLVSVVSGVALLFMPSGGFQGGRNAVYARDVLSMSRYLWKDIHTWSSMVAAAGAFLHVVLHWNWIVCMTKNMFTSSRTSVSSFAPAGVSAVTDLEEG